MPETLKYAEPAALSSTMLNRLRAFRSQNGCGLEHALVLLAVGAINFGKLQQAGQWITPASIGAVCESLALPRETARRKLLELEKAGLVKRTSYGFIIADVDAWCKLTGYPDSRV